MSDFLVAYLDTIDEQLLGYFDEENGLRPDTVRRMRFYTTALLDGSFTPAALIEDWPDWFDLTSAYVVTYGTEEVEKYEEAAIFLEGPVIGGDFPLTEADRVYLRALEPVLDMYPEIRATEEEKRPRPTGRVSR